MDKKLIHQMKKKAYDKGLKDGYKYGFTDGSADMEEVIKMRLERLFQPRKEKIK